MKGEDFKVKILQIEPRLVNVAKKLDTTKQALNQALNASDVKTGFVEKVASALGVPVTIFFDAVADVRIDDHHADTAGRVLHAEGSGVINTGCADSKLEMEIEHLKALLAEKDARLSEKDARIEELKERINELKGK